METIRHEEYMRRRRHQEPQEPPELDDYIDSLNTGQPDMVNEPPHYNTSSEIECIDAIAAATGDGFQFHLQGTVLKYLWRYRYKGKPLEDLKKARWYLDKLIEETERSNA